MFPYGKMPRKWVFRPYLTPTYQTPLIYIFVLFTSVEGRSPEFQEPRYLKSNPFQGGENDAILPPQGHWIEDSKKIGSEMKEKTLGFS